MALLIAEGFEGYNNVDEMELMRGYSLSSISNGYGFVTGRNNGTAFKRTKLTGYAGYTNNIINFSTMQPTCVMGVALKISGVDGDQTYIRLACDDLSYASFNLNKNSINCVRRLSTASPYTMGSYPISANEWYYLEIKYYVHNTAGYIEWRINEQTIVTYSGDTYYSTPYPTNFNFPIDWDDDTYLDDLYILDDSGSENNDFLGDIRIDAVFPNGAGNYAQLAPSVGNNYECVDEDLFDNSDYVFSANVGDKDSYTYEDVPTDLDDAAIYAVALNSSCKRTVAANNIQLKNMVRQGGADYSQTARSVSDDFTTKQDIITEDPSDSNPWTKAKINSAEFGVEVG